MCEITESISVKLKQTWFTKILQRPAFTFIRLALRNVTEVCENYMQNEWMYCCSKLVSEPPSDLTALISVIMTVAWHIVNDPTFAHVVLSDLDAHSVKWRRTLTISSAQNRICHYCMYTYLKTITCHFRIKWGVSREIYLNLAGNTDEKGVFYSRVSGMLLLHGLAVGPRWHS
jgi:hypothetical protein